MASKEVRCRMQLVRIRLLLCVDEYIFLGMVDFDWSPTQFPNWCSSWGMTEARQKGRTKIRRGRKRLQRIWRCSYRSRIPYRHEP